MQHPIPRATVVSASSLAPAAVSDVPPWQPIPRVSWIGEVGHGVRRSVSTAPEAIAWDPVTEAQSPEGLTGMACAIAHDVNSLLFAAMSSIETARRQVSTDSPARGCLDAALAASERASALARDLMSLAEPQARHPILVNLNALVEGIEPLLRQVLGERAALELRLAADVWPILADPAELERAVLNVVLRARDARDGGVVRIETSNSVRHAVAGVPAACAVLSITDTGSGLGAATLARAIEPFYTTGPGATGPGLASVGAALRSCGGTLDIESVAGRGTTVRVVLPAAWRAR